MKRFLGWLVIIVGVFGSIAYCSYSHAQPQQSPTEQALGAKLIQEVNSGLQCSAASIQLQRELAAAQARVKALEDKYEPKATEKPKP